MIKKIKTILVDIDDTIENLCEAWIDNLNRKYGTTVKLEDVTDWNVHKYFPKITKEQLFEPLHSDEFWKEVKPKEGAAHYLHKLIDDGYNVFLCTSTHYDTVKPKFEYVIKKYFPFIKWERVIICSYKQMIRADYLVDDGVHNLIQGGYKKILFTAPHNLKCNLEKYGMIRADNWKEVYDIITGDK